MKTYEKIENNCLKGIFTVVERVIDNKYCVFTPIGDEYGRFRRSPWEEYIETAKQKAGEESQHYYSSEFETAFSGSNLEIVETYRLEPEERFEVGDRVKVSNKHPDKKIAGKVGTNLVYDPSIARYGIDIESINFTPYINHKYLYPYYEEEEMIEIDGREVSKSTIKQSLKEYFKARNYFRKRD